MSDVKSKTVCENIEEHSLRVERAKSNMPTEDELSEMSARFKIISEPSRLKILLVLAEGELCVEHIVSAVGGNQSAVSHQLKILKDNKIVRARRQGKNMLYSVADWHVLTMIEAAKEHLNCD